MFRPLSVFIGARYLRARRRNRFVSFVSLLSLIGMSLGVAVLITVISVMNGFEAEIRNRTLSAITHLSIDQPDGIADYEGLKSTLLQQAGVAAVAPHVGGKGMLSVTGIVRGININGIRPAEQGEVGSLDSHMLFGDLAALKPGEFGVLVGGTTANHLGLQPGDKVSITLPRLVVTPMGVFPRVKRFTVVGVFSVGAQVDSSDVFIHINDAARLFQSATGVQGLRLKLDDLFQAPELAAQLRQQLGQDYQLTDWSESQGGLFQAIQMEKRVMGLLLMIVVVVAAFNIISIVVMMVSDKRPAIAVLRTMGMSARSVVSIFITQGTLIGLLGVLIGASIGVLLARNISNLVAWLEQLSGMEIFDPSVYYIVYLPSLLRWSDVLLISATAFLLSILATIYPAMKAAKVEAAEVLRYE